MGGLQVSLKMGRGWQGEGVDGYGSVGGKGLGVEEGNQRDGRSQMGRRKA